MNVLISLCQRFDRSPDGAVWTPGPFPHSFWTRYLEVFDSVTVLARVREATSVPANWKRADGPEVHFQGLPNYVGPWQYLLKSRQLKQMASRALSRNDAVILRVPSAISDCLMPILGRTEHPYGVEVVSDPYDVFSPGSIKSVLRPFLRWYFPRQLRRRCAAASAAAYVTTGALQRRYPCPTYSVGFSDVELPSEAWVSSPRLQVPGKQTFSLVTVGSLQQLYKAPDILIDAVHECVRNGLDLKLMLAGDGQFRQQLEARAEGLGLTGRVVFLGHLPARDSVQAALDSADLFVLPSRMEGLPRAMVEAMARGLPCIGSAVGGIPELLPQEDLVAPGDVLGLAKKIQDVLGDPARLAHMSARNLNTAQDYREESLRTRRLDFYRTVREKTAAWLSNGPESPVSSRESILQVQSA